MRSSHLREAQLIGYVYQTLADAEREGMDRHLEGCTRCRTRLGDHESMQRRIHYGLVGSLRKARPSSRMTFAALAPNLKRGRRWAALWTVAGRFAYAAAIFALALLVSTLAGGPRRGQPIGSSFPAATSIPPTPESALASKHALLIIQEHFNASEYDAPRTLLETKGATVIVAAPSPGPLTAYEGNMTVEPDIVLGDVEVTDHDVIVFVGGWPYDSDIPEMQRIAREAVAEDKLVAAICTSLPVLAKADVVEGVRIPLPAHLPTAVQELEEAGAVLVQGTQVERDGRFITGRDPASSFEFGEAIVAALGE
ncbi:MAG: DJ-1/PfpI family protein [Anaerolineae bacterium]|nr:DJ-1/PfpI family protein [Anaerolineae bacterium]